jgi:hypothetical protein
MATFADTTEITPVGSLSLAMQAAVNTLLASEAFADRIHDADPSAEIGDRVYYDSLFDTDNLSLKRPFALLKYAERGSNVIAEGLQVDLIVDGGILLLLEADANREYSSHNDVYVDFCNWIGQVIDQMELLSGDGDYLAFRSELVFAPRRTKRAARSEEHDYLTAAFVLHYGDQV